jgi:hypothetical protein
MKIKCYTLFDITKTDVSSRRQLLASNGQHIQKQRNQQSNLETIIQIIGLRSQPENISVPVKSTSKLKIWGENYSHKAIPNWCFKFDVAAISIFNDGQSELGYLFLDCNQVPMITGLEEYEKLDNQLQTFGQSKNTHFEVMYE